MKNKLLKILFLVCLLTQDKCFIDSPSEGKKYAELRLGDNGKRQLLIEADDWGGGLTPDGYRGYKHGFYCYFFLQGDGPVYTNPIIQPNHQRPYTASPGTITIDMENKRVIVNLQNTPELGAAAQSNGEYPLRTVNHEPFFRPDTEN